MAGCAPSQNRYRDFMVLPQFGVTPKQLEALPMFLVHADTDAPAPDARMILETKPEPRVLQSDRTGQVMFPLEASLLKQNPPIRIEPNGTGDRLKLMARFSAKFEGSEIRSVRVRSAADLKRLGDSRVAVFHQQRDAALARKVRVDLIRARGVIRSVLGLEPVRWAVILETQGQEENVLYLTVPFAGYHCWRCFRDEWESGEFMDVNPHEWAESTLVDTLDLYDDPRTRFIGDGLAEFVVWKVNGLPKDYGDRLSPAQVGGRETVDLLSAFQAIPGRFVQRGKIDRIPTKLLFSAGYALSFAFWHELHEQHGPELTSAFVERLRQKPSRSAEDAIAILAELTGDRGIGDRIRSANVEAARQRIKRLTR